MNRIADTPKKDARFELIDIPEDFGPVPLVVDDRKIKQFAFTQDDYHSWYMAASPYGQRMGHAAILANDLLCLYFDHYDKNTVVGLHTEEQLWFANPVLIDETVTLTGRYVEKYERRGQGHVVMEAEARGSDGRLLVRHRGVEIMRTQPGAIVGRGSAGVPSKRVSGQTRADIPIAATARIDLAPGTPFGGLTKSPSQDQIAVYSRVGEDFKNIHNDLDVAQRAGLVRPVMQGLQEASYLVEMLTDFFGVSWFTTGWLKVKFLKTATAGDVLTAHGNVIDPEVGDDPSRLQVEVWLENQAGETTVAGWASAVAPEGS